MMRPKAAVLTALAAMGAMAGGCHLFLMRSPRQHFTERLINPRTREGAWVGLISQGAAHFSPAQIQRAREGTFRPTKVHTVKLARGSLYIVEAEGFEDVPWTPRDEPPRLSGGAEGVAPLAGPHLLMWNRKDVYVRHADLRDLRGMLIDLTGDKTAELVLWSRYAEVGRDPTHSKLVVVDLTRDLTKPREGPRMFALTIEHGKLQAGEQMVWRPLEMGMPGLALFRVAGTSPGGAAASLEAKFPWDRRQRRFGGPTGGGVLAWARRD